MHLRVLPESIARQLSVSDQLLAYADAYLAAAISLCERLEADHSADWTDGSVVILNAVYAVELFLKGILLTSFPLTSVTRHHHDIDALAKDFERQFPQPKFAWDIPFRRYQLDILTPEVGQVLKKYRQAPSNQFRHPVT